MLKQFCSRFSNGKTLQYSLQRNWTNKNNECLLIHPVFKKIQEIDVYNSEEAVGQAKSLEYKLKRGLDWDVLYAESDENDLDGWKEGTETSIPNGSICVIEGIKFLKGPGGCLSLIGDTTSDDELEEWTNLDTRKKIARSSIVKIRKKSRLSYFGIGKVKQIGEYIKQECPDVVFINDELSVSQTKFLESKWADMLNNQDTDENNKDSDENDLDNSDGDEQEKEQPKRLKRSEVRQLQNSVRKIRVIDRLGLILQIFSQRSQSLISKYQVLLAYLNMVKTMLIRDGDTFEQVQSVLHIDVIRMMNEASGKAEIVSAKQKRVRGTTGGEGRTQLEMQRDELAIMQSKIKKKIAKEQIVQATQNKLLSKNSIDKVPRIALIGYTNVGKSALLNKFAKKECVKSRDMLFQTQFTTSRNVWLTGTMSIEQVDTIGFISNLPHELYAPFKTTLGGVKYSDIVLHQIDSSHPYCMEQIDVVMNVLKNLEFDEKFYTENMIEVWNKNDLLKEPLDTKFLDGRMSKAVSVSVANGDGLEDLKQVIYERVIELQGLKKVKFRYDLNEHWKREAWLRKNCNVDEFVDFEYRDPCGEFENGSIEFEIYIDEGTYHRYLSVFEIGVWDEMKVRQDRGFSKWN